MKRAPTQVLRKPDYRRKGPMVDSEVPVPAAAEDSLRQHCLEVQKRDGSISIAYIHQVLSELKVHDGKDFTDADRVEWLRELVYGHALKLIWK